MPSLSVNPAYGGYIVRYCPDDYSECRETVCSSKQDVKDAVAAFLDENDPKEQ